MSKEDLRSHATSATDFYTLLSLPATFSQSELDRARRKTALKYHPDKVGADDVAAAEKFHLASIGYEILSDATLRAIYDNTRSAREAKKRKDEELDSKRRADKEKLEARERGVKRGSDENEEERKVKRMAEDGRRRVREMAEKRARRESELFSESVSRSAAGTPMRKEQSRASVGTPKLGTPNGAGLRKIPSFASFSGTPSKVNGAVGPGTPSLLEATMMRLKKAQEERERKEMEAKLANEDDIVATQSDIPDGVEEPKEVV
jgi:curved DNA-binding protein CbpA